MLFFVLKEFNVTYSLIDRIAHDEEIGINFIPVFLQQSVLRNCKTKPGSENSLGPVWPLEVLLPPPNYHGKSTQGKMSGAQKVLADHCVFNFR